MDEENDENKCITLISASDKVDNEIRKVGEKNWSLVKRGCRYDIVTYLNRYYIRSIASNTFCYPSDDYEQICAEFKRLEDDDEGASS